MITKEDLQMMRPNFFNISLAESKGLATGSEFNETYYQIISAYYEYLNQFIAEKLVVKQLEEGIDFQSSDFTPVQDSEKDVYQSMSNNKYFYVRNTLYIENLSKAELQELIDAINSKDKEKMFSLITKTLKAIITPSDRDAETITNFGPSIQQMLVDQETFVIGVRFEEEDKLDIPDEKWEESYGKRRTIINALKNEAPEQWGKLTGMKCKLIEYNAETVTKKQDSEAVTVGGK